RNAKKLSCPRKRRPRLRRPQSRAGQGGGEALGLREIVQPLLVEQNVEDFDPRAALADLEAKERADGGMAKLHVDLDDRRRVPRRLEPRGKGVTQGPALEE